MEMGCLFELLLFWFSLLASVLSYLLVEKVPEQEKSSVYI